MPYKSDVHAVVLLIEFFIIRPVRKKGNREGSVNALTTTK
jgi:hypothetical protein